MTVKWGSVMDVLSNVFGHRWSGRLRWATGQAALVALLTTRTVISVNVTVNVTTKR